MDRRYCVSKSNFGKLKTFVTSNQAREGGDKERETRPPIWVR